MARGSAKIRLYVEHPLAAGQRVRLSREQAHYLFGVMRLQPGDAVALFNGVDGEWQADVVAAGRKDGELTCTERSAPLQLPPDLWLLAAPIRRERFAFTVEKAVELGAARVVPVQTEYTQDAKRVRVDKLRATAIEAAEQCGGTWVPEIAEIAKLSDVLRDWDPARRILFCDEGLAGHVPALPTDSGPWAILIGPEGGFSPTERDRIAQMACSHPISLGPRILRAETAAVAAITLWQQTLGDWG
ncbi:MAG: 16S rRNA (uracil(1498)-N(3))-methyltransferase [Pseudomonadota bacterium]